VCADKVAKRKNITRLPLDVTAGCMEVLDEATVKRICQNNRMVIEFPRI
jgi:hypothetical protein